MSKLQLDVAALGGRVARAAHAKHIQSVLVLCLPVLRLVLCFRLIPAAMGPWE